MVQQSIPECMRRAQMAPKQRRLSLRSLIVPYDRSIGKNDIESVGEGEKWAQICFDFFRPP